MPSVGSGRYSPGPGMVHLLEERVLPGITLATGDLFTDSARFPCYRLRHTCLFVSKLVVLKLGCKETLLSNGDCDPTGIYGNPSPSPLLRNIRRRPGAACWIKYQITW